MLTLKLTISALCALGLYASVFMYRKTLRARSGALAEPSVVQRPAAELLFGVPNSVFGIAYYLLLGAAVWVASGRLWICVLSAAGAAALMSLWLAYSLLFRTRMPCPYCWTSHAINWLLVLLTVTLYKLI